MDIKKLILSCGLIFIGQILVWFQAYGPLRIEYLKGNNLFMYGIAIPIAVLFVNGTRIGFNACSEVMWPIRFLTFSLGVISFTFLTWHFNGEGLSTKTITCLLLAMIIILIQVLWK